MRRQCVLVTGASGLLGSTLVRAWRDRYRVVAASRAEKLMWPDTWVGDLSTRAACEELINEVKPDVIVHAAAWTDVDACEAQPAQAMQTNAEATGWLATVARLAGSAFHYISTDAVFDGKQGGYRETDRPNPVNQYAASKLAGEERALTAHSKAVVLRIALEGWRPRGRPGFIQWIIEGLRRQDERTVCTDWVRTIIFAANAAEVLERLWTTEASGVFHAGCADPATNWQIAQAAAEEYGLNSSLLVPITSPVLKLRAARPENTSLISERLNQAVGPLIWDLKEGLRQMRRQEISGELEALRSLVRA